MTQHIQIGEASRSVNEHGAIIEHSVWAPSQLDGNGRCCGRKPHAYKTANGLASSPDPHLFCFSCNRQYEPSGVQRPNSFFKLDGVGNYRFEKVVGKKRK